ncbi:hypothetical protein EMIT0P218_20275 [Pseudomonas sp. IT-P218]
MLALWEPLRCTRRGRLFYVRFTLYNIHPLVWKYNLSNIVNVLYSISPVPNHLPPDFRSRYMLGFIEEVDRQ